MHFSRSDGRSPGSLIAGAVVSASLALLVTATSSVSAGETRTDTIESKILGETVRLNVWLPDDYDSETSRRYPVVYLLHGYGGDYSEWQRVGVAEEAKGLSVIIAMPEGDKGFWVNHHGEGTPQWERYLLEEIIPHVDSKYRSESARTSRAISGLSMGGFGAMAVGLRHPELFASVASHSGALGILDDALQGEIGERIAKIFGPADSEARGGFHPIGSLKKLDAAERPHLYLDCGSADFLLESNRAFVRKLAELRVAYEYREVPGQHDFAYWKRNVRYSLTEQLKALEAARKVSPSAPATATGEVAPGLAAKWSVRAELPDGGEHLSTLTLRREGDRIRGVSVHEQGETEIPRVTVKGDRVVLEADLERDGQEGVLRVEASVDGDELVGRWRVLDADGNEFFGGAWRGKRSAPPAKAPEAKKPAQDLAALSGSWRLEIEYESGQELEYDLVLRRVEGGLEGTLVSPRSGEYKASAVTLEKGELTVKVPRSSGDFKYTMVFRCQHADGALTGTMVYEDLPEGQTGPERKFGARRVPQEL